MKKWIERLLGVGSLLLISFILLSKSLSAQTNLSENKDSTTYKMTLYIAAGAGSTKYMGDVIDGSDANVHVLGNRAVYDFSVGFGFSKSFTANLNLIAGKLSGNENTFAFHRNFETKMLNLGLNLEYNFAGLYKERLPVLNPFIIGGVNFSHYSNITTDLLGKDENPYYYWSDGKIRNLPEPTEGAEKISRDYTYETKLGDDFNSIAFDFGGGVDLHISKAITLRLMSRYFFTTTDDIDGFNTKPFSKHNDAYFINSASILFYPLMLSRKHRSEKPGYYYLFDFSELEKKDEDGDGVKDMKDECAGTPSQVKTDKKGCPLDRDKDGIPDYRDKEPMTALNKVVDPNGVTIDYKLVAEKVVDSTGVLKRIEWSKRYIEPRDPKVDNYAVHVGAVNKKDKTNLSQDALNIPELRKIDMGDSLVIYYLDNFKEFDEADQMRQELNNQGIGNAYGVLENALKEVASEILAIDTIDYSNQDLTEGSLEVHIIDPKMDKEKARARAKAIWAAKTKAEEKTMANAKSGSDIKIAADTKKETSLSTNNSETTTSNGEEELSDSKMENKPEEVEVDWRSELMRLPELTGVIDVAPVRTQFAEADKDNDKFISSEEINIVLDEILEKKSSFTTENYNEMVNYYVNFTQNTKPIDFGGIKVIYVNGQMTVLTAKSGKYIDETKKLLADKFKEVDTNNDGILVPSEVQYMIERFMTGNSEYSEDKIHELIDLFFD